MSEAASQAYEPRLKTHYRDVLCPQLSKTFEYTNPMQAPRLSKIVLNMGVGQAAGDSKKIRTALEGLSAIAGQKAVPTRARKSIAGFKLREGMEIGAKATLRRDRMYEFLDRLVNVALPRMKDFRGLLRRSFDGNGNYALGIREHIVFPEIDYDSVDQMWGLDVVLCTSVRNDDEAVALLEGLGLPFRN